MAWIIKDGMPYNDESRELPQVNIAPPPLSMWRIEEGAEYPTHKFLPKLPQSKLKPPPTTMWRIDPRYNDGLPFIPLMRDIPMIGGAFENAVNLKAVRIPQSCKKIGEFAFTNTKLKKVKIARDCEYFPTSFPPDCEIEFYGGNFGQLYDSEGFAVIDSGGARVYVKE